MKYFTLTTLIAAALLFTACEEKTTQEKVEKKVTEAVASKTDSEKAMDALKEAAEHAKKAAASAAVDAQKAASEAVASAKVEAEKMAAEASQKAAELQASATQSIEEAGKELSEKAETVKAAATDAIASISAPAAYAKCKGCHGAEGKQVALGKSAVIAGQDKAVLIASLQAYKAGTKNEAGMGGLMKGQVASLSDADFEAIAEYLSQIK